MRLSNSKKYNCELIYGNEKALHLSQIIAGFQMLKEQNILNLQVRFDPKYIRNKYIHTAVVEVIIDQKTLCYDLADGYQSFHNMNEFDDLLEQVDFYFKRSLNKKLHPDLKNNHKLHPLSFNYHVSCKNNPFDNYINTTNNSVDYLKAYFNYLRSNKRFQSRYFYDQYENKPKKNDDQYKLFYVIRLWDHENINMDGLKKSYPKRSEEEINRLYEHWKNDSKNLTEERIEQVRILKETFGTKFFGGIIKDEYSEKVAKDLTISGEITNMFSYMKIIKQNYICVANRGLHNSIPWKVGNFVAAARAIITESFEYEVPNGFSENKNYLSFNNTGELIDQANKMIDNNKLINEMENNNYRYYNDYLRPDKLILSSLKIMDI